MSKEGMMQPEKGSCEVKVGLAEMLKGGVIVDVESYEQAKMAEEAGAVAVMALKPNTTIQNAETASDYLEIIQNIQKVVSIPVFTQCRIGHFIEAQILESLFVDFIDETEQLPAADDDYEIDKHAFKIPFVCGTSSLGEALCHIAKGAAMIRSKMEPGIENIAYTVKILRTIRQEIKVLSVLNQTELHTASQQLGAPYSLLKQVSHFEKMPVPFFAAGAIETPADVALMMSLGAEGVFIHSHVFKSVDPFQKIKALVAAVTHYQDPEILVRISMGLLDGMKGATLLHLPKDEILTPRGW